MFENSSFQKLVLQIAIVLLIFYTPVFGCDTTPSLIPGNVIDNGDGTFYMDITACIGSGGSGDGFDFLRCVGGVEECNGVVRLRGFGNEL